MSDFECEYYEFDPFWNPAQTPLGPQDLERVRAVLDRIPQSARTIVDLGCGNGMFGRLAQEQRPDQEVTSVDRSLAAIRYAPEPKEVASIDSLPFENDSFDAAVVLEVLEHLPVPVFEGVLSEAARVTTGRIVVTVPNRQRLETGRTECPSCHTLFDPDLHMRSFDPGVLGELFAAHGRSCVEVAEIWHYERPVGIDRLKALADRRGNASMASPICPVCGMRNERFLSADTEPAGGTGTTLPRVIWRGVRSRWPRRTTAKWLLAVYERR